MDVQKCKTLPRMYKHIKRLVVVVGDVDSDVEEKNLSIQADKSLNFSREKDQTDRLFPATSCSRRTQLHTLKSPVFHKQMFPDLSIGPPAGTPQPRRSRISSAVRSAGRFDFDTFILTVGQSAVVIVMRQRWLNGPCERAFRLVKIILLCTDKPRS
jgi:hypothetical protein